MNEGRERPFVSVKFTPVGRTYRFLLPDLALDAEAVASTAAKPRFVRATPSWSTRPKGRRSGRS